MKTFTKFTRFLVVAATLVGCQTNVFGADAAPAADQAILDAALVALEVPVEAEADVYDRIARARAKKVGALPVAAAAAPVAAVPAVPVVAPAEATGFLARAASWTSWLGSSVKSFAQGTLNSIKNYAKDNDAPAALAINALTEDPVGTVSSAAGSVASTIVEKTANAGKYIVKKVAPASADNAAAGSDLDTKHVAAVTNPENDGFGARLAAWFNSFRPSKKVRFADAPIVIPADPVAPVAVAPIAAAPVVSADAKAMADRPAVAVAPVVPVAVAPVATVPATPVVAPVVPAVPVVAAPVAATPVVAVPAVTKPVVAASPVAKAMADKRVKAPVVKAKNKKAQARPAVAKRKVKVVAQKKANRKVRRYAVRRKVGRGRKVQQRRRGGYRKNGRRARARNRR